MLVRFETCRFHNPLRLHRGPIGNGRSSHAIPHDLKGSKMLRIAPQVYAYKGYGIDGYENSIYAWRVFKDGEWVLSLPLKRDCKNWIDQQEVAA